MITKKDLANLASLNLSLGSYHTVYSAKINDEETFYVEAACFASLFEIFNLYPSKTILTASYNIRLITPAHLNPNKKNVCFFKRKDIEKYLKILKNYFSFTYKIAVNDTYGYNLIINNLKGTTLCHKIFVTSIRYLYEFPFSGVLYSTLQFFENHPEAEKNQLFQMLFVNSLPFQNYGSLGGGHSLFGGFYILAVGRSLDIPNVFAKDTLMRCYETSSINGYFGQYNFIPLTIDIALYEETNKILHALQSERLSQYSVFTEKNIQKAIQDLNNIIYDKISK